MTFNSGATSGRFALKTATGYNPFSKWKKLSKVVEGAQCVLGNSFVAGTLVHTDQGLKPIEEVKVGEKVKSFKERTGQTSDEPVIELMQHDGTFQLVKVTLDSGENLEATAGHPFYIQGKGWNVAANLKVGDALRLHNGITLVIKTVETSTRVDRVYNFAVAQNANYFVGMDGVLVHNANRGICKPSRKRAKEAAEHPHPGKKKPQPPKDAPAYKREEYKEQQEYRHPETHPGSAYPEPHYHHRNKSNQRNNYHFYYPNRF